MPVIIRVSGNITPAVLPADREPDQCPICHSKIIPKPIVTIPGGKIYKSDWGVIYTCPNFECGETFIAYYVPSGYADRDTGHKIFKLSGIKPVEPACIPFPDVIKQISPSFCDIHTEAHKAEEYGLTQICGVGYRKALEFLIKDYVIKNRPAEQAVIEAIMLGQCIENYVTDPRIKEVAKRATWLGNDETHYQRRWIDKDLNDLKTMIGLVRHWIEAEHLTEEALQSMPAPVKP